MMTPLPPFFGFGTWGAPPFVPLALFLSVLFIAIIWTLVWKGLALWKAARRGERYWFVALLIVNTFGILEILYLYVFSKDDHSSGPDTSTTPVNK